MGRKKKGNKKVEGANREDAIAENKEGDMQEGEKKEEKNEFEKSSITIVLKIDMHCEGCITKILKSVKRIEGVDRAKADMETNKLTVRATTDPSNLREELQKRTKRKVDLISPQPPKKENKGGENQNSNSNNNDKKSNEKKPDEQKPKEPPVTTAVLKVQVHCTGCIAKIHKIASKTKGVYTVAIDKEKDLVTVKGTMDAKAVVERVSKKMTRQVEIVPPKKEKEDSEGNGGGKKKGGGGGEMVEWNQMELFGYPTECAPGYWSEPVYGYPFNPFYAPQMFSDENPNACSIM